MACKITYSPEILCSLNRKNIYPINPETIKFFNKFPKNKYEVIPYNNKLNRNFPTQNRKTLLPKVEPFSDEKILFDLKVLLGKLNEENITTILEQILQLNFTESSEEKVAELLHETTIKCIFLVKVYVDVILGLESKCKKIVGNVNKCIIQQLYHPKQFDPANDAVACETAEQKTKKWRLNNAMLISELFMRNKYQHQFIVNKILVPLINHITPEDTINIEVLNKMLPIIGPKLEFKHKMDLSTIFYQLDKISKDKTYPPRLRFLIMDIIDLKKKGWKC